MKAPWLLLAAVAALLVAAPAGACACGVALDSDVTAERALIVDLGGREEIIASFDLTPEGVGSPAVVIPVPTDPQVEELPAGDPLTYLDIATAPVASADDEGAAATGAGGVDVIGRDLIGGYDVTRLRAGDSGALDKWLADNGYTLPDGAEPILGDYVEEGWRYVAIRLAPGIQGRLKPLRISFETDELVYPMRLNQLAANPVKLTLYVLSNAERSFDGLEVEWSGAVSELEPEPPAEVAEILEGGTHLTKLTSADARMTRDIVLGGDRGDASWWAGVLALLFALGGVTTLVLSRRV